MMTPLLSRRYSGSNHLQRVPHPFSTGRASAWAVKCYNASHDNHKNIAVDEVCIKVIQVFSAKRHEELRHDELLDLVSWLEIA